MDTNLVIALVGAPLLFALIAWIVVYSRRQHQKNIRQTSIRSKSRRRRIACINAPAFRRVPIRIGRGEPASRRAGLTSAEE